MAILTRKETAAKEARSRTEEIREKRLKLACELKEAGLTSARYVAPDFLLTAADAVEILANIRELLQWRGDEEAEA